MIFLKDKSVMWFGFAYTTIFKLSKWPQSAGGYKNQ